MYAARVSYAFIAAFTLRHCICSFRATIYPSHLFGSLGDVKLINRDAYDISKKRVEAEFEGVIGCNIGIDPVTFEGKSIRKSNDNYTHDGEIVTCPYGQDEEQGVTYQRYIDMRTPTVFFGYKGSHLSRSNPRRVLKISPRHT